MKCPRCGGNMYKSIGGKDICPHCGFGSAPISPRQEPAEQDVESFATLSEAVAFIVNCLETNSATTLLTQMASASARTKESPGFSDYFANGLFPRLADRHRELDLRRLYQDWVFPEEHTGFTLGGHDKELGHIHIIFSKQSHGWVIKEIFECL